MNKGVLACTGAGIVVLLALGYRPESISVPLGGGSLQFKQPASAVPAATAASPAPAPASPAPAPAAAQAAPVAQPVYQQPVFQPPAYQPPRPIRVEVRDGLGAGQLQEIVDVRIGTAAQRLVAIYPSTPYVYACFELSSAGSYPVTLQSLTLVASPYPGGQASQVALAGQGQVLLDDGFILELYSERDVSGRPYLTLRRTEGRSRC